MHEAIKIILSDSRLEIIKSNGNTLPNHENTFLLIITVVKCSLHFPTI